MKIFEYSNMFLVFSILLFIFPNNLFAAEFTPTGVMTWEATSIHSCDGYCYIVGDFIEGTEHDGFITVDTIPGHNYEWRLTDISGSGTFYAPIYDVISGIRVDELIIPYPNPSNGSITYSFMATTSTSQLTVQALCTSVFCTLGSAQLWDMDSSTPIPFPSATPTVEPTSTPIPNQTIKTVFIPGLGGSWNTDAMLNCTPDLESKNWELSPFAEEIYTPILSALSNANIGLEQFYYDWRQPIADNSISLSKVITDRVNIVGHSMGGLIAADYAAKSLNINKLLAIGSPFKGTPQAYPAWAGGDIWEDNFIAKIATTLYLKHCGGIHQSNTEVLHDNVPSINNLLPTFNYLVNNKSKNPAPSSNYLNNWVFDSTPLSGITFRTLTGSGFNTLHQIKTIAPNKAESIKGEWLDGKATGKIYSMEGDGTVLLSSSRFDDKSNITINQTHSGLVSSGEGINKILEFLDLPQNANTNSISVEPTSALVIIAHPSIFWVANEEGKTKKDKDGVVAFVNPKPGSYRIVLTPKSSETLVIIAQFMPNGGVNYKEYNFKGTAPLIKNLKFDLQKPVDDILSN